MKTNFHQTLKDQVGKNKKLEKKVTLMSKDISGLKESLSEIFDKICGDEVTPFNLRLQSVGPSYFSPNNTSRFSRKPDRIDRQYTFSHLKNPIRKTTINDRISRSPTRINSPNKSAFKLRLQATMKEDPVTPSSDDDGNQIQEITKLFTDPNSKFSRTQTFDGFGPGVDKRGTAKWGTEVSPLMKESKGVVESKDIRRSSLISGRSAKRKSQVQMDLARLKIKKTEVSDSDSIVSSEDSIGVIYEKEGEDGSEIGSPSPYKRGAENGKMAPRNRVSGKRGTQPLSVNVG